MDNTLMTFLRHSTVGAWYHTAMQHKDPPPFEAALLDPYAQRITTGIAMVGGVLMLPILFW
jgi:hypothetical protein